MLRQAVEQMLLLDNLPVHWVGNYLNLAVEAVSLALVHSRYLHCSQLLVHHGTELELAIAELLLVLDPPGNINFEVY